MTPNFTHDCKQCVLWFSDARDWYVCPTAIGRTIVSRFGHQPDEYVSVTIGSCAEVTVTELAAMARGFEFTPAEIQKLLTIFVRNRVNALPFEDYAFIGQSGLAWDSNDPNE